MKNVERKDLAKKLGVDNILVTYFAEPGFKTSLTVIINKDFLMDYVGQTYSFVPLTSEGLGQKLNRESVTKLLNNIKEELDLEIERENQKSQEIEIEKE